MFVFDNILSFIGFDPMPDAQNDPRKRIRYDRLRGDVIIGKIYTQYMIGVRQAFLLRARLINSWTLNRKCR